LTKCSQRTSNIDTHQNELSKDISPTSTAFLNNKEDSIILETDDQDEEQKQLENLQIPGEYQAKVSQLKGSCDAFKDVPDDVVVQVCTGRTFDLRSV
jgi:hypothetical protein